MSCPGFTIVNALDQLVQLVPAHPMAVRIPAWDDHGEPTLIQPA